LSAIYKVFVFILKGHAAKQNFTESYPLLFLNTVELGYLIVW